MKRFNKFVKNNEGLPDKQLQSLQAGFTLIELLVVISIIGVLIAISLFGTQGVFENSRNTKRKSDLKQYQTTIENYANQHNGTFPQHDADTSVTSMCNELGLGAAATNCPEDPKNDVATHYSYEYNSNGVTEYTLSTRLEITGTFASFFVICSNGKVGVKADANDFTTGTCPF